jgi:S-methylmethionine-dependent homocysteine/selenocysteine methylase
MPWGRKIFAQMKREALKMANYRSNLPQLSDEIFLTDGGIETTLIFHEHLDLPSFAAFTLLDSEKGREALRRYFRSYAAIAMEFRTGFILESPTWRASLDWGRKVGYSQSALAEANRQAIAMMRELRDEFETDPTKIVVSGCIGPRGDGYNPAEVMTESVAEGFHSFQTRIFQQADADMVTAITMTNVPEAVGIARAATAARMPVAIAFTVETDGRLPTGQSLKEAIEAVDRATGAAPAYYMINCAHPTHFESALARDAPWVDRIRGIRANASRMSHAELDGSAELDEGNPVELAAQYRDIRRKLPHIGILGGCCGTDERHVREIAGACIPER